MQPIGNPGTISLGSTPQLVSVIMPGMIIVGESGPQGTVISPYGTFGSTGTGGVGTYGLTSNQVPVTFTGSITTGGLLSLSGLSFGTNVAVGMTFTWNSGANSAHIMQYGPVSGGGTGGAGTYQTDYSGAAVTSQAMTTTGGLGLSSAPIPIQAFAGFYYGFSGNAGASTVTLTKHTLASIADWANIIGNSVTSVTPGSARGWGGAIGNVGMLYGTMPMDAGGYPSASAMASLCNKTTTIPAFAAANGMTLHSLYELNDIGIFGDSSYADFHGHTSGSTLTVDSTETGALPTVAASSPVLKITGPGLPVAGVQVTSGSAGVYALASSVGTIASEAMKAGAFAPATPIAESTVQGYIDGSPATTLHVVSLDNTGHSGFVSFTGSLGSEWTGSMAATTGVLTISGSPGVVAGVGTIVNSAPGAAATFGPCTITSLVTGAGGAGTYNTNCAPVSAIASELMDGTGQLPSGPTTLNVSGVTGTIQAGMVVTDGGASLTGPPLLITANAGANKWTVLGNYYPPIAADATMTGTLSTLVPGEYIRNSALTTPVKVLAYQGACGIPGAINGGLGCYTLSNAANGTQGSSGTPLTLVGTTITDGGAIAPGPALTISDSAGPGLTFPVTNLGAGTGLVALSGTYDAPTLGGTPSGIQVLVSNTAGGPALTGCTPCNWGTLTGTISGGAWSGSISGIPAGGPYSVSIRAANGTAYATLPSPIRVGLVFDMWGQGQTIAIDGGVGGVFTPYYQGLWGRTVLNASYTTGPSGSSSFLVPTIANDWAPSQTSSAAGDRFGVNGSTSPVLTEGLASFEQTIGAAFGWPRWLLGSPPRWHRHPALHDRQRHPDRNDRCR